MDWVIENTMMEIRLGMEALMREELMKLSKESLVDFIIKHIGEFKLEEDET